MTQALLDSDGKTGWRSMLGAVPLRNSAAIVELNSEDELSVRVKSRKKRFPIPLFWIVPQKKDTVLKLDKIGMHVWNDCDGERNVEGVIEVFAERFGLTFHESRVAVTNYLKRLIQRGALAIVIDSADENCDKKGTAIE